MNEKETLVKKIHGHEPWETNLETSLAKFGFQEPARSWKDFISIAKCANFKKLYPNFFSCLLDLSARSYNADLALHNLDRFVEKFKDKEHLFIQLSESKNLFELLILLFSGSQTLTDSLLSEPSYINWLIKPETLAQPKSIDILMRDFYEMAGEDSNNNQTSKLLRKFKRREYLRIGLRDLLGNAELMETVKDISNLADVCIQIAYEKANEDLQKKHGIPSYKDENGNTQVSEFAVLGMGKLGGQELNYSSDIDIIYIYTSSRGETLPESSNKNKTITISNHEYYSKLSRQITEYINEITSHGNVFRVDLELRPDGPSGEIANSLASCETYYQSWGRTWERQAMIKARISAGSDSLARNFFGMMEPFIFRRSLDFEAIEEIKSMKSRIDINLKRKNLDKTNIKLGFGGIREVEFIIQAYQLLFGGRNKELRIRGTLDALKVLKEKNFINEKDYLSLEEAYVFLRHLENRVQITFGLQTHQIPESNVDKAILARKMRIEGGTVEELVNNLMSIYESHTSFVAKMFSEQFSGEEKKEAAETVSSALQLSSEEELFSEKTLTAIPLILNPNQTFRFLKVFREGSKLSHPSEKSIKQFDLVLPKIIKHCKKIPSPGIAIENLCRFVESTSSRDSFLKLFAENEKFLELLLILFGSSGLLSQILINKPEFVDLLSDMDEIYRFKTREKILESLNINLITANTIEKKSFVLRQFKHYEELRIGIRYLIKEADLEGTLLDLSNLADVYLQSTLKIAIEEVSRKINSSIPEKFCIVGLGKYGGRELNFGSDLDIIFVYDEPDENSLEAVHYNSLSQLIYKLTSEMNSSGFAYKIDTELRPEGEAGVLVLSVEGYKKYFKSRARIWEQQAMIKARIVAGEKEVGKKFMAIANDFVYRNNFDYSHLIEISRLRERMEIELAKEETNGKNVKLGYGGIADIEFTIQILQLIHGKKNPRLRQANTIESIKMFVIHGIIDQTEADLVKDNYLFLRKLECALRIIRRAPTNSLPKEMIELAQLARFMSYSGNDPNIISNKLFNDYEKHTKNMRQYYRKTIGQLLRTRPSSSF